MLVKDVQLSLPNLHLAARLWGELDALPVIALHGWMDNAASFEPLAPLLAGVRLAALDLPGHGLSEHRPPGNAYHFVDYIPDVLAAADALGWQHFTLLGHSLGAGLASFIAAAAPERVERLLLIEGTGPLSGMAQEGPQRMRNALRQAALLRGKAPRLLADREEALRLRLRNGALSESAAALLVARATERVTGGLRWRHDRRLALPSPYYLSEEQVLAFLSEITCPALLIQADQGLLGPRNTTSGRCAAIHHLQRLILPGGHHLHMDVPQAVATAINHFLALHRPT